MPVNCVLICGGQWHDFDYVRTSLTRRLARYPGVRTRPFDNYDCADALAGADVLVSYTCQCRAEPEQREALVSFVARGGRWLALHGTNAGIDAEPPGRLTEVLGSRFIAHPPIGPFLVEVARPEHPLVAGVGEFEVTDELYLCELHGPLDVLLHARFQFDDEPRPVLYLRAHGNGEVCYLTVGHVDEQHQGSWSVPQFHAVLDRALARALGG